MFGPILLSFLCSPCLCLCTNNQTNNVSAFRCQLVNVLCLLGRFCMPGVESFSGLSVRNVCETEQSDKKKQYFCPIRAGSFNERNLIIKSVFRWQGYRCLCVWNKNAESCLTNTAATSEWIKIDHPHYPICIF